MNSDLCLNHLNLPARDPDGLRDWYVRMLGFRLRGRFLWSGGSLLVFVQGEPLGRRETHFGFRVGSLEELRTRVEDLRERGLDPGPIEGDADYATVFLADPEGNRFEIFYEPVPEA